MKKAVQAIALLLTSYCVLAQSTTTNNTLSSTGVTGIQSTAVSAYKLSVGGMVKQYGTGLNSSGSPTLFLRNTTASTGRGWGINSSDGGLFQVYDSNASNAIRFVLNSSGYLGINTTSPGYHLDVNGSIRTAGNIFLPAGTSSVGVIYSASDRFLHTVGTNSTFFGVQAGSLTNTGSNNTGIGQYSLSGISTGSNNTAVGEEALYSNNTGGSNTALGQSALKSNTSGSWNTAVGTGALNHNTTGNGNTAVGEASLPNVIGGSDNTGIGSDVLAATTTGSRNVAMGNNALGTNVSGNENTAIGRYALTNSTSDGNTAVGLGTGNNVTSGSGNSFFGWSSGLSIKTGSNNSFFGYNISTSGTTNLAGNSNTAIGSNISGMGSGSYNTAIGAGFTVPAVDSNIIIADGRGNQRVRIFSSGNTLLGYTSYADNGYKLDVNGSLRNTGGVRMQGITKNNALTRIVVADASGNLSWRDDTTFAASGANLNNWSITGNSGINPSTQFIGTTDAQPVVFKTNNTERLRLSSGGAVGIGTTNINDTAYKLFVESGIRTRKVKVDIATWSDYVFNDDYRLSTLAEVQEYINQHKHLPGVPSAEDVTQNGIDLGNNQSVLLKKIEELTLYAIDQDKQLEDQNKKIDLLQQQIDELRKAIKK